MKVEDMILVSIDDHVIEPPDMFQGHVPEKWSDQAPKLITDADGRQWWEFQGARTGNVGLNAVVTWPKEEWGLDPAGYAEMRPGAYDIHERVRDMNRNGILASMCFPTFPGFSAGHLSKARNELSYVMIQAYNDWHIDEWATEYPGRFIPLSLLPTWDPSLAAAEIRRISDKGCPAVTMPELPHVEGLPSYHDLDHWGPVFQALGDTGTVMCLHIGQGFAAINSPSDAPIDNLIILATQVSTLAAQDLLWGPAMRSYPAPVWRTRRFTRSPGRTPVASLDGTFCRGRSVGRDGRRTSSAVSGCRHLHPVSSRMVKAVRAAARVNLRHLTMCWRRKLGWSARQPTWAGSAQSLRPEPTTLRAFASTA